MTWNVEDFVNLLEGSEVRINMLHLISENNPDILCLQEFTNVEGANGGFLCEKNWIRLVINIIIFLNDEVVKFS